MATAAEKVERDAQIVAMRTRGTSELQVAATFGVSRTTVQRVTRAFRESNPTLRHSDPLEIIDELLEGFQADLEELAYLSQVTKSDTARIGAINARMLAREKIIQLLQSTGVLPHDLGQLRVEIDIRYIAQRLVAILSKHEVSEDVQRELLETLQATPSDASAN